MLYLSLYEPVYFMVYTDGHHKLIRWRFVTHAGIDGYSRLIVFMKCSTNNRASTVLDQFLKGVRSFGLPSRVRSDFGRENVLVARYMLSNRGPDRNSMITGCSTHNQRIVARLCHKTILSPILGILDHTNAQCLYALEYVFLPRINHAIHLFVGGWSIRTAGRLSPRQLFASGILSLQHSGLVAVDFVLIIHMVSTMRAQLLYKKIQKELWYQKTLTEETLTRLKAQLLRNRTL